MVVIIGGFGFPLKSLPFLDVITDFWQQQSLLLWDINLYNQEYRLENMAEAIYGKLSSPANTIVAYSSGGLVALKLANLYPNAVSKIIMINSTPKFIREAAWPGIAPEDFRQLRLKLAVINGPHFLGYFARLAAYPQTLAPSYRSLLIEGVMPSDNWHKLLQLIFDSDLREEARAVADKLFWINSASDKLAPPHNKAGTNLIINNSSHLILNRQELISSLKEIGCQTT